MTQQRAQGGGGGRGHGLVAQNLGGGEASGQKTDRGAFHIAFHAGDLARKTQMRRSLQPQGPIEQTGGIEKGIAVKAAQPREFCLLQAGNGAEDADLFGMFQLGLKAHHIPQSAQLIVLAQLHHRMRALIPAGIS